MVADAPLGLVRIVAAIFPGGAGLIIGIGTGLAVFLAAAHASGVTASRMTAASARTGSLCVRVIILFPTQGALDDSGLGQVIAVFSKGLVNRDISPVVAKMQS